MSTSTPNHSYIPEGRPLTLALVIGAGVFSAAFNVWGAHHIYSGVAAWIFAGVITCFEGLAIVVLRHILTDWDNNNYFKSAIGGVAFAGIVLVCAFSGFQAFTSLNIDVRESNASELRQADRMQERADEYYAIAKGLTGQSKSDQSGYGDRLQIKVDNLRKEVMKKQPPAEWVLWLFLATFEVVKMFGRHAFAVPSRQKWSWARRQTEKLKEREKKAAALIAAKEAEKRLRLVS